jgi:ABC-type transport system involved in multi-copper enzyme maturation permease subunit
MIRLIRAELLKIRTTRTPYGLLATAIGVTGLIATLDAARAGKKFIPALSTSAGLSFIVTITGFALLMALVFGVIVSCGEFRHGTATATYLAVPARARVLVAKALASFGAGAIFGTAGAATATAAGLAFAAGRGGTVQVGAATLTRFGAGAMLAAGLLAVLGTGIGALIRSQLAGVVGVLVWCLLLESILAGITDSLSPYLPFTAAATLAGSKLGGRDVGFYAGTTSVQPLPFAGAAFLILGLAVVISAVAARTTVQADIS